MPMRRRRVDTASRDNVATSWPNWVINPRVGSSDRNSRRSSEVLPAPEGPVQELEGMRLNAECEVAQDLRPQAVAQAYILESDHTRLR